MKVRRITSILLSLLCLCLVLTLVPSTARAEILFGSEVASVKIGIVTEKYYSLEEAIDAVKDCTAANNAVVKLMKDIDLGDSCLQITSGVFTIDLNGNTLSGSNVWVLRIREFNEHRPNVTIKNGTISNSEDPDDEIPDPSFGVGASRCTVTIQGVEISGTEFGVDADNSTVTIQGCKISGTKRGVETSNSTVTIKDCIISGTNYGVYAYSNSTVDIRGCTISGGTNVYVEREDSGVYADHSTVTIQGGSFSGHSGVYAKNSSTVTISGTNTTISGKTYGVHTYGSNITIQDATVSGTNYGVDASDGTVTISGCEISGKTGVYVVGADRTATITNCTITSTHHGVYAKNSSTVTISGCEISPTSYGVYAENSTVTISGETTISGKTYGVMAFESTVDIQGGTIKGTGNDSYGVYADSSADSSSTVTISGDKTTISGTKNGVHAYGSTVEIQGGTITGVTGVYVEASSALTISGGEISGYENSKSYGVYALGSEVNISGGRITGGPFANRDASSYGMFVKNSKVTIEGGKISGGENPDDDISGTAFGVEADNSIVTISGENTTISGKTYGVKAENSSKVTIEGGKIEGDTGVHATFSSIITISGGEISGGKTSDTNYGVYASDSEVTIGNGTISGYTGIYVLCGTADIQGGEISGTKYAVHAYCRNIEDNQCSPASVTISGGTISGTGDTAYGVYAENGSTVDIQGGTMDGSYGVCAVADCEITISGGEISGGSFGVKAEDYNIVNIQGGEISGETGVSAKNSSTVTIEGGTISGTSYGVKAETYSKVTIQGGEISGDTGVFAENSTVTISGENTTISGKTYGVYADSSTVTISGENTTISGDKTTISGGSYGVKAENYSIVTIQCGDISGACGISASYCEVTIKGDTTISGKTYGVYALKSTVKISGGTISGKTGVYASESRNFTISGGEISGETHGLYALKSTVDIQGGTISSKTTISDKTYGVYADSSTVTISDENTTISGKTGVYAKNRSTVDIKGGTISGTDYGVYAEPDSTVTIQGGEISGDTGVYAAGSTVTISGENTTISGTKYGVDAIASSKLTISGGEISGACGISASYCEVTIKGDTTISGGSYGVYADNSTVNIQGGEISGDTGVFAGDGSTVTISGGTISGETYGVNAFESTVKISGGTISGTDYGVDADNSTVTISGGTISGTSYGVYANGSTVKISGGTISGTRHGVYAKGYNSDESTPSIVTIEGGTISGETGVYANESTVNIQGGEISGTSYGVRAYSKSKVTVSGSTIKGTGNNSCGVDANSSTVTIEGGKISGTKYGVYAKTSTVNISGGTISGTAYGVFVFNFSTVTISGDKTTISGKNSVYANRSTVTIQGGEISGETNGVYAENSSTVTIQGGTISGTNADLRNSDSTITLTLAEGASKGATFPGGITVDGTTLDAILDEASGIRYWGIVDGKNVMLKGITGTALTDKGDITVQAVCGHQGYAVYLKGQEDGIHLEFCDNCQNPTGKAAEPHVCDKDTGKCICGIESAAATVTTGETTSYYLTLAEAIAAAQECDAEDEAVVKPTKDIDLGDSYLNISSGVFTIDLNGKKLSSTNDENKGLLYITGGSNITISDSSADKTGKISDTKYGVEANNSTVNISGGTIKGTGDISYGVYAYYSNVTISGENTTISGGTGVYAFECTVEISGGTISGADYGVYAEPNSTVTIQGGEISGFYSGVYASECSTVTISGENTTISGGTIEGKIGVYAARSTVIIDGGKISGYYGVDAMINSTVTISGGTISGEYGVAADSSNVTISGGTVSGSKDGVYVIGVFDNEDTENISTTVTISGENTTISGTSRGMYAKFSAVTIQGGTIEGIGEFSNGMTVHNSTITISGDKTTISGTEYGMSTLDTTVNIQGGTIEATGEDSVGVRVNKGSTIISGGTISGTTADLCNSDSTITLTLADGAAKGATFPGGITVDGTTLDAILDEASRIRYWGIENGKDVMLNGITGTALTDKGDITVRAVCDHTGSAHTEATDKGDGTHGYTCTICQNPATEDHPYHPDHGKCICGAQAVARIGDTYFTDLSDAADAWHIDGGTLTLLTDISHDSGINTNTPDSVLELNGRTLTVTADVAVWVNEEVTLTIRDSSAEGTGKVVAAENPPLYNNGGTVVLESGTLTGKWVANYGTITINGGSVITSEQCAILNKGTLTINGGTISSSHDSAIMMYNKGTITVNGGTISGNNENSGTIKVITSADSAEDMALTLNGGTVSGPVAVETDIGLNTVTARLTLGNVKLNSTQADLALLANNGCKVEVRLTQVPEEPYTVNPSLTDGILLFGYSSDSVPADPAHYKSTIPGVLIGKNESGVVYAYLCDHSGSQHTTGTTLVTGGHSFVCTVCQLNGFEDHHGGTATCMEPAKCAICRADYGEKDPDNHCGETFLHGEKKATCSAEGYTGDTVCYCGTLMAEGTVIPKLPHTYQDGECTGCGQPDPDAPGDDGEGEPGIPSEPTEPAPSDPTEPAPSDPTEPAPSDPTEPAPSDPTEPAPSEPTEPSEPEEPETPATSGIIRLAGKDRYLTGFAIADQLKSSWGIDKFQTVVVAYGKNFPDALSGSYLAAVKQAPILLTESGRDTEVLQYIQENLVSGGKVYILGGTAAVSLDFEKGAADFGYSVERLKGANRFDTNLAILEAAGVNATDTILIATGKNYADSLSASATGLPMVLVDQELTQAQKDFLAKTSKNFVILGGTGAVSAEVEAQLDAIGDVTRVKGASRYETSVEIAKRFFAAPTAAVLAYAQSFPDGLCGGPLALSLGAPMILTGNDSFAAADAYISGITTGAVCGGSARISDDTVRQIFDLPGSTPIVKP